jgi:hypothetical protein
MWSLFDCPNITFWVSHSCHAVQDGTLERTKVATLKVARPLEPLEAGPADSPRIQVGWKEVGEGGGGRGKGTSQRG